MLDFRKRQRMARTDMNFILKTVVPALITLALGIVLGLMLVGLKTPTDQSRAPVPMPLPAPAEVVIDGTSETRAREVTLEDVYRAPLVFDQIYLLFSLAAASDTEQLLVHLSALRNSPDPLFYRNGVSIMLERMTALDPLRAMTWIEENHLPDHTAMISHVLTSWIRNDPEPALDYFLGMTNQQVQFAVGARLLEDPTLAQSGMLDDIRDVLGDYGRRVEQQLTLQRTPPDAAFEQILNGSDPNKLNLLTMAANRWFRQDPEGALSRISVLENIQYRSRLMQVMLNMQASQDPQRALALIATYAPDDTNLTRAALSNYARIDPMGSLPRVESFARDTGDYSILGVAVSRWLRDDRAAALAYIDNVPAGYREQVMQRAAYDYVRENPDEGIEWVMSLPPEYASVQQSALTSLHQFPALAERWLDRVDNSPRIQQILLQQVAQNRARRAPETAYRWLEQHADKPGYEAARTNVLNQWAHSNPSRVATLIQDDVDNPNMHHVYQNLANTWFQNDAEAAMDWFEGLPSSEGKVAAFWTVIHRTEEPWNLVDTLASLPEQAQQEGSMQIAYRWNQMDPEATDDIIQALDLEDWQADQLREARRNFDRVSGQAGAIIN